METKYLTEKSYSLSRDADRLRTDANKILKENEVIMSGNCIDPLRNCVALEERPQHVNFNSQELLTETKINREELQKLLNRALSQQKEVNYYFTSCSQI